MLCRAAAAVARRHPQPACAGSMRRASRRAQSARRRRRRSAPRRAAQPEPGVRVVQCEQADAAMLRGGAAHSTTSSALRTNSPSVPSARARDDDFASARSSKLSMPYSPKWSAPTFVTTAASARATASPAAQDAAARPSEHRGLHAPVTQHQSVPRPGQVVGRWSRPRPSRLGAAQVVARASAASIAIRRTWSSSFEPVTSTVARRGVRPRQVISVPGAPAAAPQCPPIRHRLVVECRSGIGRVPAPSPAAKRSEATGSAHHAAAREQAERTMAARSAGMPMPVRSRLRAPPT